ncbi:alpha/beta fold hydrolase [Ignavibacterium sp.]|uniref:alpha/beta fold hydrolase n=1 Tax=Ignavibacterium sp. TaxID=2651167 RepID=UPI0021FEA88C|nr:alpha/beta fold hydrolase [Ignavibacterium sp.]BDQ01903.1 MAG: homoserine O-acetyltransferase [Ignavibacterium sp.]
MNRVVLTFTLVFSYSITFSQSILDDAEQQYKIIGNFITESGETIKDCKLGYRVFGTVNNDSSNIILYCTWFGGNSEAIGRLIRKYQFIDTSKFLIIAVDALGNGVSSSPSNYQDKFPEITIKDMINSQFNLIKNHFKLKNIYAIIGGSMGSMQALQWSVTYPDFAKKIIAYVPSPKLSSYDMLWINTQIKLIETLRKYKSSEREIKTLSDMMTALYSRTSGYIVENIKPEKFDEYLNSFNKDPDKIFTIDNYLSQLKAILKFDISKDFEGDLNKAAKQIRSKLFMIISKRDMMVNPTYSYQLADMTGCRTLILDNNCGHLAVTCEIDKVRKSIDDFLKD